MNGLWRRSRPIVVGSKHSGVPTFLIKEMRDLVDRILRDHHVRVDEDEDIAASQM